jgi:hypothetical protein
MPREQGYICEISTARLDNIDHLLKHRSTEHRHMIIPLFHHFRPMGDL